MTRESELKFIREFQAGNTRSFDSLVLMFREKGYNLAYQWTGNQEDALDVLQESFIKMYKILPGWRPESSIFTWLYRVIINTSIDLRRRKSRVNFVPSEIETDEGKEELPIPDKEISMPDRQTQSRELGRNIQLAVMKLPKKQREAFILKNMDGLSLKEIAETQKCSVGTVKANLFQAVRKLRQALNEYKEERLT